jgi:hypothetical protein
LFFNASFFHRPQARSCDMGRQSIIFLV